MNFWIVSSVWLLVRFLFWFLSFTPSERVALASAFLVFWGVAGEYIIEFKPVVGIAWLKDRIKHFSMAILVLGLAGDVLGIVMSQAEMRDLVKQTGDAATNAQSALKDAGSASKIAGEAKGKAKEAEVVANGAEAKAKDVNKELSQVAVSVRQHVEDVANPRMILPITPTFHDDSPRADLFKEVRKFSRTKALIQVVRIDDEPKRLEAEQVGRDIAMLLLNAGWQPSFTSEGYSHLPNAYIQPGVWLYTLQPSPFKWSGPEVQLVPVSLSEQHRAEEALCKLLALDLGPPAGRSGFGVWPGIEYDGEHDKMLRLHGFEFPRDTVLILVGVKPVNEWWGPSFFPKAKAPRATPKKMINK